MMNSTHEHRMPKRPAPFVSIVTPVFNGEPFIADCIESVLHQTFEDFEYIIVDNCSTDRTLAIAKGYADRDPRVRIHCNDRFVGVAENHNVAFGLISSAARYCKVVSADDLLFPACVEQLLRVAEMDESVALVGSFQLSGRTVRWQGFDYPRTVFSGREICRRIFLEGDPSFGCGAPTSLLYRADLVRAAGRFYPNSSPHADTSACFRDLRNANFGFVYQVLSYERVHSATESARSATLNEYAPAYLSDIIQYGCDYLTAEEFRGTLTRALSRYDEFLAASLLRSKGREFWSHHRRRLQELGYPLSAGRLAKGLVTKLTREIVNPGDAVRKSFRLLFRTRS